MISPVTSASLAALQEDREFEHEARIADPRHPRADLDLLIEQDRRLVLDDRFDDVEIDAGRLGVGKLVDSPAHENIR